MKAREKGRERLFCLVGFVERPGHTLEPRQPTGWGCPLQGAWAPRSALHCHLLDICRDCTSLPLGSHPLAGWTLCLLSVLSGTVLTPLFWPTGLPIPSGWGGRKGCCLQVWGFSTFFLVSLGP